jgi:hypothetical protein
MCIHNIRKLSSFQNSTLVFTSSKFLKEQDDLFWTVSMFTYTIHTTSQPDGLRLHLFWMILYTTYLFNTCNMMTYIRIFYSYWNYTRAFADQHMASRPGSVDCGLNQSSHDILLALPHHWYQWPNFAPRIWFFEYYILVVTLGAFFTYYFYWYDI